MQIWGSIGRQMTRTKGSGWHLARDYNRTCNKANMEDLCLYHDRIARPCGIRFNGEMRDKIPGFQRQLCKHTGQSVGQMRELPFCLCCLSKGPLRHFKLVAACHLRKPDLAVAWEASSSPRLPLVPCPPWMAQDSPALSGYRRGDKRPKQTQSASVTWVFRLVWSLGLH
jgi:hypothetical protein